MMNSLCSSSILRTSLFLLHDCFLFDCFTATTYIRQDLFDSIAIMFQSAIDLINNDHGGLSAQDGIGLPQSLNFGYKLFGSSIIRRIQLSNLIPTMFSYDSCKSCLSTSWRSWEQKQSGVIIIWGLDGWAIIGCVWIFKYCWRVCLNWSLSIKHYRVPGF